MTGVKHRGPVCVALFVAQPPKKQKKTTLFPDADFYGDADYAIENKMLW